MSSFDNSNNEFPPVAPFSASNSLDTVIGLITDHQVDLQAYIMSTLGNYNDTLDVLQLTNIVLWKKAEHFDQTANFLPWALKVAKYEILAFMRKRSRDRLTFSPELIEMMADTAREELPEIVERREVLYECIRQLPKRSRELIRHRYSQNSSLREVSERTGLSLGAIKSRSLRIRRALAHCVKRRLAMSRGPV